MLVLDSSGSIDSTELTDMQNAFKTFVDVALVGDTQMAVLDFDSSANFTQVWSASSTEVKSGIDALTSGGDTNWEAAINTAATQFPHRTNNNPDVIIFASDGNPTEPGSNANALAVAQTAANNAKAAGIFIKTIGIGDSINGANLSSISSDNTFIDSDFAQLESDLLDLADTLCEQVNGDDEGKGGNDRVINDNRANVTNNVNAGANTGHNMAGGSTGGSGGRGGDIANRGGDIDTVRTGNGGRGGNATPDGEQTGAGGLVNTGAALAQSVVTNTVNVSSTTIDRCACNGNEEGNTAVRNTSRATLDNTVGMPGLRTAEQETTNSIGFLYPYNANSGANDAQGSDGGTGGRGGDATNRGGEDAGDIDDSQTGNGGEGGTGDVGGTISTSRADAFSDVLNRVNVNRTHIRR
jgi:uncharacterized protein YegL